MSDVKPYTLEEAFELTPTTTDYTHIEQTCRELAASEALASAQQEVSNARLTEAMRMLEESRTENARILATAREQSYDGHEWNRLLGRATAAERLLEEERSAHLATRQELSMSLARVAELEAQVEDAGPCEDSQNENACGSCPACREASSADLLRQRVEQQQRGEKAEARVAELEVALQKVSDIRDSIVGMQGFNFSEHAYPLVAVLDAAGFKGKGYEIARESLGTLIEQIEKAEAECDKWKAACLRAEKDSNATADRAVRAEQLLEQERLGNEYADKMLREARARVTELETRAEKAEAERDELLAGPSLCSSPQCEMHCGYGHAQGCDAIRAFLSDHGGTKFTAVPFAEMDRLRAHIAKLESDLEASVPRHQHEALMAQAREGHEELPLPTGPRPTPDRLAWLMSGMPKVGRTSVDIHVFDELRAEVNARGEELAAKTEELRCVLALVEHDAAERSGS